MSTTLGGTGRTSPTTGGTTPTLVPTPTSVPTFTPRSLQQSSTEAAAIRPQVKQADWSSLSSKAYDSLQAAAVEGITTKFDLMISINNADQNLTGTYTLDMVLQHLFEN